MGIMETAGFMVSIAGMGMSSVTEATVASITEMAGCTVSISEIGMRTVAEARAAVNLLPAQVPYGAKRPRFPSGAASNLVPPAGQTCSSNERIQSKCICLSLMRTG